jgi:tetratricopeptide (TPR) repeat protein
MKKIIVALFAIIGLNANAQIKMPAASPTQTISQDFGLGKIEISYSRPGLKGRAAFGNGSLLAPIGIVWRTGANAATKVTFSDPVTIGNTVLAAGSYGLFTIPGEKEWTIIFNTNSKGWGSFDYKEAEDVVRLKVPAEKTSNSTETFTINVENIAAESATISLKWATTLVNIPVKTDIKPTVRKQIEESMKAANVTAGTYQAAANFFYEMDKDYDKALVYADKAINSNGKAYWLFLLKAKIQKELGDKKGARLSAETCIKLAEAEKNADYVRSGNDLLKSL